MLRPVELNLESRRILVATALIVFGSIALLAFLDVFVNHYRWTDVGALRRLVNITREDSISNWFSALLLLSSGGICFLIALAYKSIGIAGVSGRRRVWGWTGIALFFSYMGFDDGTRFHERMGTAFGSWVYSDAELRPDAPRILDYFPSYEWQVLFGPLFVLVGLAMLVFLWRELKASGQRMSLLAAFSLYGCAVVLDFIEGLASSPYRVPADFFATSEGTVGHMSKLVEESMEMAGTGIFLLLFLGCLFRVAGSWRIRIDGRS
ncbi:MAG: hypothetical protein OEV14_05545 [Gammaproteobacteria bacterium]|nr:hypothetical protein [Gammaproteobacteria bacterium]